MARKEKALKLISFGTVIIGVKLPLDNLRM